MPFWQARRPDLKTGLNFIFDLRPRQISTVSQHWLYWEAKSICHLNKLLKQSKSVSDNYLCLLLKKWRKSKKTGFFGASKNPIFWPDGLIFEKCCVWSKVGSLGVKNFHFWNFLNISSLSSEIGLLAWTQMKNENKAIFQIGASRLSKWHPRFFWRIFLRLDSILACSDIARHTLVIHDSNLRFIRY